MDMKVNVGMKERQLRIVAAIFLAILTVKHSVWWSIPSLLLFVSGVVGLAIEYSLLGINTNKKSNPHETGLHHNFPKPHKHSSKSKKNSKKR